ncbi:CHAT domain-containing protein [[Leptolyngbya] sp. PCC 7376]|uniref:CHAT domain-containing protein n=1 Tax=[Leptolyngbya] sp. PCC 7376 TaxID=111781 RepID=UPI00135834C6|nr:CHAT domain-containing protein [[Leptolyngbya] sp. PCC 7376]
MLVLFRSNISFFLLAIPTLPFVFLEPQQQAIAQITPAGDGTGTIVNQTGSDFEILGGSLSGDTANLFHNFSDFNLSPSQSATFFADPNIQNILSRISGGNPSFIDGLLRVNESDANLFLVNPAGLIFGANAQLDIGGSFTATTSTRIGFGEDFLQSFGTNNYAALNGNPTSFVFDDATGMILNQGNLAVPANESLWLVGSSVLNLGTLSAPNGNISLTAIPEQRQIKISQPGNLLSLALDAAPIGGTLLPNDLQVFTTTDLPQYLTGSSETVSVGETGEVSLKQNGENIAFNAGDVGIAGTVQADTVQLMATGRVTPTDFSLIEAGESSRGGLTVVRFRDNLEDSLGYTFIDQRADNPDQLLFGGESGTIATIVLKQEAGLDAVTNALLEFAATGETLDAINIVAEGNEGYFWLGSDLVDGATLEAYQAQLQQWRSVLGNGADLLLYSCFTALGMDGEALLTQLAELTETDVAASLDVTGSAEFDGNWDLEYSTGDIEASNPFTLETLATWEGRLATILVQNLNDNGPDSLREAFSAAVAGDLIIPTISGNVVLTTGEIAWTTDNLVLDGTGQFFAVDGNGSSRIFNILAPTATIEDITIRNGSAFNGGGIFTAGTGIVNINNSIISGNTASTGAGIYTNIATVNINSSTVSGNMASLNGGGIQNSLGTVNINNSTIENNSASNLGGGISNDGTVNINSSTISGNTSSFFGGGIYNAGTGIIDVNDSNISNNDASAGGGASNFGSLTINNSSIFSNSASSGSGGGIDNVGTVNINNSTISGNTATTSGGGIYDLSGIVNINNSTISGNSTQPAGGGGVRRAGGGTANLTNSIITNSIGGDWSGATPTVFGFNLVQDGSVAGAGVLNVDPLLAPLGDYGGSETGDPNTGTTPLQTHLLLPSSPAFDVGDDSFVSSSFEQRGGDRQVGIVDLGAVEFQGTELFILAGDNQTALTNTAFSQELIVFAEEAIFGNSLEGIDVDFLAPVTGASTNPIDFFTVTDIFGEAAFPASANGIVGAFDVFVFADTGIVVFTLNNTDDVTLVSEGETFTDPFIDLFLDPFLNSFFEDSDFIIEEDTGIFGEGSEGIDTVDSSEVIAEGIDDSSITADNPEEGSDGVDNEDSEIGGTTPEVGGQNKPDAIVTNGDTFLTAEVEQAAEYGDYLGQNLPSPFTPEQSQSLLGNLDAQTDTKTAYLSLRFRPISNNLASDNEPQSVQLSRTKNNHKIDTLKPWLGQIPGQTNGEDPLEVIITTANDEIVVKTLPITRRQLKQLERELLRVAITPNQIFRRRLDRALESIHQQVFEPIEETLREEEISNLLISLGRDLRSVPWAALYDGEQYLIEKYSLSITPNLSLTDTSYRPLHDREMLAMGASSFSELNDLPAVPTELELITQQFDNSRYFLNEEFTEENLLAARDEINPGIIHLATHASFQGGNLQNSYIQLWGEEQLAISEMKQLQWFREPPVELLVLSACQTALGNPEAELGFGGLAIQAGVRSAVASLWEVSDVGTMALMSEFYQNLRDPNIRTKAEALRQAQIALIRGDVRIDGNQLRGGTRSPYSIELSGNFTAPTSNSLAHPYYWSAFTLIGSPW